jgi:hypothetical protein
MRLRLVTVTIDVSEEADDVEETEEMIDAEEDEEDG